MLASNSLTPAHQTEVLLKLDKLGLSVSYAPTMDRAFDYEVQLKAVKPEEVLGRKSEIRFDDAVQAELENKSILVTGAGGSIGSEICHQILRYQPEKLIILELSELALYTLEQELSDLLAKTGLKTQIDYVLGSVKMQQCSLEFSTHKKLMLCIMLLRISMFRLWKTTSSRE